MLRAVRVLGVGLAVTLLAGVVGVQPAMASDEGDEWDFVALINQSRAEAGLPPLGVLSGLRDVGRGQAARMGQQSRLYHNPNLASDVQGVAPDWQRAGENVGQGWDTPGLHQAFMNSPGHRANILGDFNYVGLGVVHANGYTWVAEVFVKAPPGKPTLTRIPLTRVAGATDADTSLAVSRFGFAAGQSDAVVVGRVDVFADALTGGPLAAVNHGPVLLTPPNGVSQAVVDEARRVLKPGGIVYLLGGSAALSPGVELAFASAGLRVERLAGPDRYGTAAAVAARVNPSPGDVFVASGVSFADAMVAGAPAAQQRAPILLATPSELPSATTAYLGSVPGARRTVVGGTAVVGDGVARAAGAAERVAGADRYETAVKVAQRWYRSPQHLSMASGGSFQDALAGSPYSAKAGIPVVLVPPSPTAAVRSYVSAAAPSLTGGIVYGTTNRVPPSALSSLFG